MNNIQKYESELQKLVRLGVAIQTDLYKRHQKGEAGAVKSGDSLEKSYQRWFTEACFVIKQLLPDRLAEFEQLYKGDGRSKRSSEFSFTIQNWLMGMRAPENVIGEKSFNDIAFVANCFSNQLQILESVEARFESQLFNIKQFVQSDLFDSEVEAAKELANHGFLRAAGVIAGVVLERHLSQVAENHNLNTRKKNLSISVFNDLLKDVVTDFPSWRDIQRLGDIRNLCAHDRKKEPTKEQVEDLISGVEKYTHTLS